MQKVVKCGNKIYINPNRFYSWLRKNLKNTDYDKEEYLHDLSYRTRSVGTNYYELKDFKTKKGHTVSIDFEYKVYETPDFYSKDHLYLYEF